jgi:hypothetical protein
LVGKAYHLGEPGEVSDHQVQPQGFGAAFDQACKNLRPSVTRLSISQCR